MDQKIILAPTLIDCFINGFHREGLVYCHWKSNMDLAQATAGDIDLDLLVDRKSLPLAQGILARHGFKAAIARWGANPASIYHYYGLDPATKQLVHVHLFSSVLTGESYVKSHLFPFERMLLENVDDAGGVRIASKPAELVLFTMRMFVKYGSLLDLLALRRKSDYIKEEVRWLQNGGDLSEALLLLQKYCPVIDEQLFVKCVKTLDSDSPLITRVILAWQVRRRLKVYAKYTFFRQLMAYGQLFWAEAQRRLGTKQQNKALQAGGAVIAFVGAEATGKSTLVTETRRWLGGAFAVRMVHAGKPPATWLTAPFSLFLPLMRRRLSTLRTNRLEGHSISVYDKPPPDKSKGLASLLYAWRSVILAWERRQLLVRARRAAANGEIVICDRYPSDTIGAMDSPRLCEQSAQQGLAPAIFNWLARLEQQLYKQIPPPDIVLRLHVSVETALQRNRQRFKPGKETDAYITSRHRQIREWHKFGTKYVYDIDTEQSLAETISCVKKTIWESL